MRGEGEGPHKALLIVEGERGEGDDAYNRSTSRRDHERGLDVAYKKT
jgi:hypothetical protein